MSDRLRRALVVLAGAALAALVVLAFVRRTPTGFRVVGTLLQLAGLSLAAASISSRRRLVGMRRTLRDLFRKRRHDVTVSPEGLVLPVDLGDVGFTVATPPTVAGHLDQLDQRVTLLERQLRSEAKARHRAVRDAVAKERQARADEDQRLSDRIRDVAVADLSWAGTGLALAAGGTFLAGLAEELGRWL